MKQDTLTTREKAEIWWNQLPDFTKDELNVKYWFDTIETIYLSEQPLPSKEETIKEQSTFVIPTNMKDIIASYELGDITKESKLEFLLPIAEEIIKLKEENQALKESNTRLKEALNELLSCLANAPQREYERTIIKTVLNLKSI